MDWSSLTGLAQEHWWSLLVGLLTGGFLGNVKNLVDLYDRFKRPRIVVDRELNGRGGDLPNYVHLTNMSEQAQLVSYWELVWRHPRWMVWKRKISLIADSTDRSVITLEPRKVKTLTFAEDNWFDWGASVAKGRRLIFRYMITGERGFRVEDVT